jgi:endonuclease III
VKNHLKQLKEIKKLGGNMRLAAESWPGKFQTLISTILSARSLDETTIKIATILFKKYPNAAKLSKAKLKDVEQIIRPVNFYRNKARNIISCSKELDEKYKGVPPMDHSKLIELSGVGNKTASVLLSEYGDDAIAVDTHVFYISRYLDWSSGKTPDDVQKDLMKLFPKKIWKELNPVLVRFGKKYTSRKEKDGLLERVKELAL